MAEPIEIAGHGALLQTALDVAGEPGLRVTLIGTQLDPVVLR